VATGQHEAAWAVVGDSGYFPLFRPSFEALDWLDPADQIPRWSDGLVEGIGWLGGLGILHGDPQAPHRALEAVPAQYHENIAMPHCRMGPTASLVSETR
jgi:hypothetical protein